jgi:hypothetical protein
MNFERSRPSLAQSIVSKIPSAHAASAVWVSTSTTSHVTLLASTIARIWRSAVVFSGDLRAGILLERLHERFALAFLIGAAHDVIVS